MSLTPSCVPPNQTHARSPFGSHGELGRVALHRRGGEVAVWPPPSRGRRTPSVGQLSTARLGAAHDSPRAARWAVAACSRWVRSERDGGEGEALGEALARRPPRWECGCRRRCRPLGRGAGCARARPRTRRRRRGRSTSRRRRRGAGRTGRCRGRPGRASRAISSTFSSPCGVSIIASTTVASLASAGFGPIRSSDRIGP